MKPDVNMGFGPSARDNATIMLGMLAMSGSMFDPIELMMAALYKKLSDGKKDGLAEDIKRVRKELDPLEERSRI